MAKEFGYASVQTVAAGSPIILNNSIPNQCCGNSDIYHEDETGIITLAGPRRGGKCNQFADYKVTFIANIAVPATETPGEISVGLVQNGEVIPVSIAIQTPTVVDAYTNVTISKIVRIPRMCGCEDISVENASIISINVQNANLNVARLS